MKKSDSSTHSAVDSLIDSLVTNLKAVTPMRARRTRTLALWVICSVVALFAAILFLGGLRPTLVREMGHADWFATLLVLTGAWLCAIFSAWSSAIPGAPVRAWNRKLPWIAITALTLGLLALGLVHGMTESARDGFSLLGLNCAQTVALLSLVPAAVGFFVARSLAPIHLARTSALIGIAAGSVGAVGVSLLCPSQEPVHWALWHVLPILGLAGLAALVGKKLLRW